MEWKDRNYLARLRREEVAAKTTRRGRSLSETDLVPTIPLLPTLPVVNPMKWLTQKQSKPDTQPAFFSTPKVGTQDKVARTALQIAKRAAMQAHPKVEFSDAFKAALIEMVKTCLLQDNQQLAEKLQGDNAVHMRERLASKLTQVINNDIRAFEDAIADWKSSDEEWQQICKGLELG